MILLLFGNQAMQPKFEFIVIELPGYLK